ncbi:PAS domain-containing protein [Maribacter aestuarii]|uniref:PAS domain-containing protein n=1 Tax=Maribacter aestuarii TaxID=1130723 RepID=UPI0025A67300|nr:PAS domain-containing protein [Maribacter aestuarii]
METLMVDFLVKDAPSAIAVLDTNLKFVSCSDVWLDDFDIDKKNFQTKGFSTIFKEAPTLLHKALKDCLNGENQINKGQRFSLPSGRIQWLKWKINSWKDADGNVLGLFISLEDITEEEREKELLLKAEEVSKVGGWEVNMTKSEVYWSRATKSIHEVPNDYIPNLEEGINFYKEGEHREKITQLVTKAIAEGKSWDTELIIVTAKGNEVWVRAKGEAELVNGKCARIFGTFQNIDEKKKAEIRYQKIAERLKIATENANIGIWEYDIVNNSLIWDDNMYNLYGLNKGDFSGEYAAWEAGVHPEDKERGAHEIDLAISGVKEFDTEFRVLWPDGTVRNIKAIASTERDDKGKAIKMIGVNWDITPMKQADFKIKEMAERLNVATRVANIGIWDYQIKENQVHCNDNMYDMYGISKDSSNMLEEWMNRIHPEDYPEVQENLQSTIDSGKPFNTKFRGIKPNGDTVHLVAFGEAQYDLEGKVDKVIGANWDITELLHTKLKLERSKESFLETFENSAIGMALVGPDNKWIKVNKTFSNSLGYTQKELMGLSVQEITHPDDLDKSMEMIDQSYSNKRDSYQMEKRYFNKEGAIVHAMLTVTIVRDVYGGVSHSIAQILDMTDRIKAEKRLSTLVNVTKEQNESLLNFAHIVSHNLRSHSTNMSMLTKFLVEEKKEEERENLHGMLINASNSLSETIEHLNDVVQAKTGALEKMQSVNLSNTFEKIEKGIRGLIAEQNAISKVNIDKSHFVEAVPAYLESILLNLYTNALKYRAPNRSPIVEISTILDNDHVIIEFKDNGQGIDLERHKDKIFGMYKTFHRNKDAKGIGLFITKNQIESMSGTITVKSTVGEGSTFYIKLKKG